jgi:two-component system sensor histidine kinase NreB
MRELAVQTLEAVHNMAVELRPVLLDDLGLAAAAQRYIESYERQYGMKVELDFANPNRERFMPEIEITLYRILQEALTNIVKHAKASRVQVTLRRQRGKLVLSVSDNGVGFCAGEFQYGKGETGLGIYGMKERVALLNGQFDIKSRPGRGTTITVEIPLEQ